MTTEAVKALFQLLDSEEDDFSALVRRFELDPAKDFQHCDLSNVDFGKFAADVLDLTGSNLQGANLSQVKCNNIIGWEAGSEAQQNQNVWDAIVASIQHYQNSDWVLNQVVAALNERSSPVLAFYHSTAEQDVLTKRLCAYYSDASHLQSSFSQTMGTKLLWFYSKASKGPFHQMNPAALDKVFFESLRSTSDDIGIYPFRANQNAVSRIRQSIGSAVGDQMRMNFAKSLRSELNKLSSIGQPDHGSVVIFSGFPPISKRLYRDIRDASNGRISLIFLCSANYEPYYLKDKGMPWRRVAVPAYSIGEPLTVEEDIRRLCRRVGVASRGLVVINDASRNWMEQFVGKSLASLKKELAARIRGGSGRLRYLG